MANASNKCHFVGRVVKDPDISTVQGGPNGSFEKARFSIAVNRSLSTQQRQAVKNGDTSIKTCDFVDCEAIGNVVTNLIKPYIIKGKAVVVVAHYEQFEYQDKNSGEKKYGHKFIVDDIDFATQDSKDVANNNNGGGNGNYNGGNNNYNNSGYNNGNYNNNNYGNNNRQQQPPQQNGFAMFDDSDQPF
jgi:single-strand DNA-binding protein